MKYLILSITSILVLFSSSLILNAQCNLVVTAGDDLYLCPDESVILNGEVTGEFDSYEWTPGDNLSDPTSLTPEASEPGTYTLTARFLTDQNIIVNGDFSQGVSSFTSDYRHSTIAVPIMCPSGGHTWGHLGCEGTYNVLNNPQLGHSAFSACTDQNGDGNMLVVNGSSTPGSNVWCQTVAVNGTSEYEFSVWATSVVSGSPAILQFFVNNAYLGTTFSPTGAVCSWSEQTALWAANGASSATICVINQNTSPGGNDFALDNISFKEICIIKDEVEVIPVELEVTLDIPDTIDCQTSSITLSVEKAEGTGPKYTGVWTNNLGNEIGPSVAPKYNITVTKAGVYTFTYTFESGNSKCETSKEVTVIDNSLDINAEAIAIGNIGCSSSTAIVQATGTSFDKPYSFQWYTNNGLFLSTTDLSDAEVGKTGEYFLIVFDLASGCADTTSVIITGSADVPNAVIEFPDTLNCANPTLLLVGTNSYVPNNTNITWESNDGHFLGLSDSLTTYIDSAGTYRLLLFNTDNSCADTFEVVVHSNFDSPDISIPANDSLDCQRESFKLSINLNKPVESVIWLTPIGVIPDTNSIIVTTEGTYIVHAINQLSHCEVRDTMIVTANQDYPIASLETPDELTCLVDSVELNVSFISSNGPTNFLWTTNSGVITGNINNTELTVLSSAWYYFNATDQLSSCTFKDSVFVSIDTLHPVVQIRNPGIFRCGVDSLQIKGFTNRQNHQTPYWYREDGSLISDSDWKIQVTSSGLYTLEVVNDSNGCRSSKEIEVLPDQNIPLLSIDPIDTITCIRQYVTIHAFGTSQSGANINYTWSNSDDNSIGSSDEMIITEAGEYTLTIVDESNNCSLKQTVVVAIDTIQPSLSLLPFNNINCSDTSVLLTIDNNSNDYTFLWTTRGGQILSTSTTLENILVNSAGAYALLVTNQKNGCHQYIAAEVIDDSDYPSLSINTPEELTCKVSEININSITDDNLDLSYSWSGPINGLGNITDQENLLVTDTGSYTLTIQNLINGCISSLSIDIKANRDTIPVMATIPNEINCSQKNSQLEISLLTTHNYEIEWSNENNEVLANNVLALSVKNTGVYSFSITDLVNGCISKGEINVLENNKSIDSVLYIITDANCSEDNGLLQITEVIGGTSPYQAFIDNTEISITENNSVSIGSGLLKIIDINGCELEKSFTINGSSGIDIELTPEYEIELGGSVLLIPQLIRAINGFSFIEWSPADNLSCIDCLETSASPTETTEYILTVTDANGCTDIATTIVNVVFNPKVFIPNSFSPNADGKNEYLYPQSSSKHIKQINSMSVFSRWGEQVFFTDQIEINQAQDGWDGSYKGKEMDPAVFVYYVEIEFINGIIKVIAGDVTLVK